MQIHDGSSSNFEQTSQRKYKHMQNSWWGQKFRFWTPKGNTNHTHARFLTELFQQLNKVEKTHDSTAIKNRQYHTIAEIRNRDLPISEEAMELNDDLIFIFSEIPSFKIRAKIVNPSQATTLATAEEASGLRKGPPAALAVRFDIGDKTIIFFLGPSPFVCMSLLTTRRSSHGIFSFFFP